jgi:HEAT repeat protein
MGVAWRGNVTPVPHQPDPRVEWSLPAHLRGHPVSGTSLPAFAIDNSYPPDARLELGDGNEQSTLARPLSEIDEEAALALPSLIKRLQDGNAKIRRNSARALSQFGPAARPALPALAVVLDDQDPKTRYYAAKALSRIEPGGAAVIPVAVRSLAQALKDHDGQVRCYCARALGKIGPGARSAISALKEAALDSDPKVREKAVEAIKTIEGS